jgi:Skp family chaperone for outer membrane proteins
MKQGIVRVSVLVSALVAGAAQAEAEPLAAPALARCATQVQTLREESARLNARNEEIDARRSSINARKAALDAERPTLPPDDLAKGLDFRQRAKAQQADAVQLNADLEQLKREVAVLNRLKDDYDANCAQRSYRRKDLDALPPAAQAAMRAGMNDVQVPYVAQP